MENYIKVAVIDTYINENYERFQKKVKVLKNEKEVMISSDHGTAICNMIINECENVKIDVFPVFENSMSINTEILLRTLQLIYKVGNYDIVLMSLGTDSFDDYSELQNVCQKLKDKNTVLVAAFNNVGGLSIPAAFDSVIGVDISGSVKKTKDFFYLCGGAINVLCSNQPHMVVTGDKAGKKLMAGTSISAAYICGHIAKGMWNYRSKNQKFDEHKYLKETACKVMRRSSRRFINGKQFLNRKIALFPFQKETESMVHNFDYLKCTLMSIYDFSHSKYINTEVTCAGDLKIIVKDYKKIDWDSIDALVLGHMEQYMKNDKLKNIIYQIVKTAQEKKKLIYSFDNKFLKNHKDIKAIIPQITEKNLQKLNRGRLWNVPLPTIAIIGTGARQGKFSTLIRLKSELTKRGFNAAAISTEPSGPLFDTEYTFPYGFSSEVNIKVEDYPVVINQMICDAYNQNADVLLMELQSAVLGRNVANISQNMCKQDSILFGLNPDAHVLIVYPDDDLEYISRANLYMEIKYQSTLAGILIFPYKYGFSEAGAVYKDKISISDTQLLELKSKFGKCVIKMDMDYEKSICDQLIDTLTS